MIFASYGKATELLVKAGADINAKDAEGKTLVMRRASDGRYSGTVLHLYKLGANIEGLTPWQAMYFLRDAVEAGDLDAAKAAIQAGADVNAKPNHGGDAFFTAVQRDRENPAMVQLLIEHGANVRHASPEGVTAFTDGSSARAC